MLLVLVGMVGLSVDVGNTYAEQRQVVRATNAASVSAMQSYINSGSDAQVKAIIDQSFAENGITALSPGEKALTELGANERHVESRYLDASGNPLGNCVIGECVNQPEGAAYIQIESEGRVETYFARALGQDQLPVNGESFAGRCLPIVGVFPLAVNASTLNMSGTPSYVQSDGLATYGDIEGGQPLQFKRLYLSDPLDSRTTLGLLRWQPGYDSSDLVPMLEDDGNLDAGFQEAPWSVVNPEAPDGYPLEPDRLTLGDWVYGIDNADANWAQVRAALEPHIQNRTRMILPIFSEASSSASGGLAYYTIKLGLFYVLEEQDSINHSNPLSNRYLDLIYLGDAPAIPCNAANVLRPDTFGLAGSVQLIPQYGHAITDVRRRPVGYMVMLDVSGSMNYDIRGWGVVNGTTYQCQTKSEDPNAPPWIRDENQNRGCLDIRGQGYWDVVNERRIALARNALVNVSRNMDINDRIRVVAFGTGVVDVSNKWFAPDDPFLENHLLTIGQPGGGTTPTFIASGATAGPAAVLEASQVIRQGDFPKLDDGEDNRRVVIYTTDGVANRLLTGSNSYHPDCRHLDSRSRGGIARCQYGLDSSGRELPISSMIRLSDDLHSDMYRSGYDDFIFYVLAMGRPDTYGLSQVSTSPNQMFSAGSEEELNTFLDLIRRESAVVDGCEVRRGERTRTVNEANRPNPATTGASDIFGYVSISQNGVERARLPIMHDANDQLEYRLPPDQGLEPGTYEMSAWMFYNGSGFRWGNEWDDFLYDRISIENEEAEPVGTISFIISDSLGDTVQGPNITLHITEGADICAGINKNEIN